MQDEHGAEKIFGAPQDEQLNAETGKAPQEDNAEAAIPPHEPDAETDVEAQADDAGEAVYETDADAEADETEETDDAETDEADGEAQGEAGKKFKAAQEKKRLRNWWIKTVLMLVLIGLSMAIMLTLGDYVAGDEQIGFVEMVKGINVPLFFAFLGFILLYILEESVKYSYMLKRYTGKFRIRTSVKVMFLGKYYDGVTPFASGGQPFQIYYLYKKRDIPRGAASAIPLARMSVSLFVWCLFALVLMSVAPNYLESSAHIAVSTTVRVVAWFSIVLNLSFPILFAVLSFFPKFTMKVMAFIIFLLKKMHIVKKQYFVSKKYVHGVREYCTAMRELICKWYFLLPLIVLSLIETCINVCIPFFAVVAIANVPATADLLLQIACLNIISQFSAYLIPTPGNTGAVETTTSFVYASVLMARPGVSAVIGWVILIWRFFTFYIYILSGIGINIFEIARGAVRNKRARNMEQQNG